MSLTLLRKRIPRPLKFREGDMLVSLKEFETVAKPMSVKKLKAKTVIPRTLTRGSARVVYDSCEDGGERR